MIFISQDILKTVNKLLSKYKTNNPYELADYLNIQLLHCDLGGYYGCYRYLKKHRCIFINSGLSEKIALFVLAHELGHAILHQAENCYFMRNKTLLSLSKIEKEANLFAAYLLMPQSEINDYIKIYNYSRSQIANIYGVPDELVDLRLKIK